MDAIGIDIGRVIIGPTIDGVEDTAFIGRTVQEAMQSPPAPGAFSAVGELMSQGGLTSILVGSPIAGQVFYWCGNPQARSWRTGVPSSQAAPANSSANMVFPA